MTAKPSHVPARRILLAEDDESMRAFIERALLKAGYEVTSFAKARRLELVLQMDASQLRAKSEEELYSRILWKNVIYADDVLDITADVLKILAGQ